MVEAAAAFSAREITGAADEQDEFRNAVTRGLSAPVKTLECKYFYDETGSALFDQICRAPEYYPTRTEIEILSDCAGEIAEAVGTGAELIELGSGASMKTRILLRALQGPRAYVPVDISADYMRQAAEALQRDFPLLAIAPAVADFSRSFQLAPRGGSGDRLLFFPGSTIGNFDPTEATKFLARMRRDLVPDMFVIGFDLRKDRETLEAAYDDAAGVTAAFNLNLLSRINREFGGNFDLAKFRHAARFNETESRVEMHIVSRQAQTVYIDALEVNFAAGESIHSENSYKYSRASFETLAAAAGWRMDRLWTDEKKLFAVALLVPGG